MPFDDDDCDGIDDIVLTLEEEAMLEEASWIMARIFASADEPTDEPTRSERLSDR